MCIFFIGFFVLFSFEYSCSEYNSFIRYMICQYFLQVCGCLFILLSVSSKRRNLKFWWNPVYHFFSCVVLLLRNLCLPLGHKRIFPCFLLEDLWFCLYLRLFFYVFVHSSGKLAFPSWNTLGSLSIFSCLCMWGSISDSILFHKYICLFLCQYHESLLK